MKRLHKTFTGLASILLLQAIGLPAPLSAQQNDYRLKPDDSVVITVFGNDELTTETTIPNSGQISFPLIGNVELGGKTIAEAVAELTRRLGQGFVNDPKVSLVVTDTSMAQVIVLGRVRKPGAIDLPADKIDLLAAIALAGGFDENSNSHAVSVRRTVGDDDQVFKVDARELATSESAKPFLVQPNDIISVPEEIMDTATVMGAVAKPGLVEISVGDSIDIITALAVSGGFAEGADPGRVLVRRTESGRTKVHTVDADALINNASGKSFQVRAGDVVTVPALEEKTVTVMGQVQRPGLVPVMPGKHLTLLDAIATAGGYTTLANPKKITLKRDDRIFQINGKKLASDSNAEPILLEPGDVVVIPDSFF